MITRCVLPFQKALHRSDLSADAFKRLLDEIPKECPNEDCSPGGCYQHCRDFALGEWVRSRLIGRKK